MTRASFGSEHEETGDEQQTWAFDGVDGAEFSGDVELADNS